MSQFTKQKHFIQTSIQLNSFEKEASFHWSYASPSFWAAQMVVSWGPGLPASTVSTNLARQLAWRLRTHGLIMPPVQGRVPGTAQCCGSWGAQRHQSHGYSHGQHSSIQQLRLQSFLQAISNCWNIKVPWEIKILFSFQLYCIHMWQTKEDSSWSFALLQLFLITIRSSRLFFCANYFAAF